MDEGKFWEMIQAAHDGNKLDMDAKCAAIRHSISNLPKEEATEFFRIFHRMLGRAFTWPLWGAAYVIGDGCSDDAFYDFRSTLISCGKLAYENAVADPDSLADADIDADALSFEGFQYAVREGVEAAIGSSPQVPPHPLEPTGKQWSEDELYERYPRLGKLLG